MAECEKCGYDGPKMALTLWKIIALQVTILLAAVLIR